MGSDFLENVFLLTLGKTFVSGLNNITNRYSDIYMSNFLFIHKWDFWIVFSIVFILSLISIISLIFYVRTTQKKNLEFRDLYLKNERQKKTLDRLFRTSPVGILITDINGEIFSYNKEFLKLFRLDQEKNYEKFNIQEILYPHPFEKLFEKVKRKPQNFEKVDATFPITLENGEVRFFQHICYLEEFDYDPQKMLIHIFVDFTTQKQLELELKKSEEKYRTYIELSTDAIFCFEANEAMPIDLPIEEQIVWIFNSAFLSDCNLAFAKYYGFTTVREAIGTPLAQIINPSNPSKVALIKDFVSNNYSVNGFITYFTDENGKIYYVRNSLFGIIENNKLVRAWGAFHDITELIDLQKQYRETATKYENLVENLNSILLHMDMNGNIIYMNNYGLKFFGYTKEELIDQRAAGTIVPREESGTGRNLFELIQQILQDPLKFEYNENENIKKDGTRVWISWKNTPIYDSSGKCVKILSVGIDRTEQKKKELELVRTWKFIYSMVDALPDAVCIKDADGRWIYANKSMLEVFNLVGKEVVGKTDLDIIEFDEFYKEELEGCVKSDQYVWEAKSPVRFIEIIKKKEGGSRIFDIVKVPTFNDDGTPLSISVIARDVTYQKEVEDALKESEQKHKEIVNLLPLPAFVVLENKVVFANHSAKSLFQEFQEGNEVEISMLENYFDANELAKLLNMIGNDIHSEKITSKYIPNYGEKIFAASSVSILFGSTTSTLFVLNDVTEQVLYSTYLEKVQRELISQKYELERVNNQLNSKNRELAELNATKDRFFSIIAHDLKNPIHGIKNLSDEFLRSFDELKLDEKREFVYAINSSSSKLADLIEDLLLWARTQTQTIKHNPVEVNLKYVVENTVSFFQHKAKQKNIVLLSRIDENTSVFADVNSVSTILRNLISNSIKFTNEGGVVRIFSQPIEQNGKWYEQISVQDNGVGIPYEVQDKLLQLDFHFSALGTKNETGTGLGLNITKELLKINGGKLWFESKPKVGTTFHFILPRKEDGCYEKDS